MTDLFVPRPDPYPVNERGQRIGQGHPRANLTDHEVDMIRQLHEEGQGYKQLAKRFETPVRTIRGLVSCSRRATTPAGWRQARD